MLDCEHKKKWNFWIVLHLVDYFAQFAIVQKSMKQLKTALWNKIFYLLSKNRNGTKTFVHALFVFPLVWLFFLWKEFLHCAPEFFVELVFVKCGSHKLCNLNHFLWYTKTTNWKETFFVLGWFSILHKNVYHLQWNSKAKNIEQNHNSSSALKQLKKF